MGASSSVAAGQAGAVGDGARGTNGVYERTTQRLPTTSLHHAQRRLATSCLPMPRHHQPPPSMASTTFKHAQHSLTSAFKCIRRWSSTRLTLPPQRPPLPPLPPPPPPPPSPTECAAAPPNEEGSAVTEKMVSLFLDEIVQVCGVVCKVYVFSTVYVVCMYE